MIGMAIAQRLDLEGKVGATHMGTGFDAWYPGYIDYNPVFKNIPAFWTETQGTGPSPRTSQPNTIPVNMRRPQSLYVESVARRHVAHARCGRVHDDRVDRDDRIRVEVQGRAALRPLSGRPRSDRARAAARRRTRTSCRRTQRDPAAAVEMLRRLAFGGVRVYELTAPRLARTENRFPAGTWVVPTDQEFAALAREVLDVQKYPDIRESPGGPLDTPYDAAGWTLPLADGRAHDRARRRRSATTCARSMKLLGRAAGAGRSGRRRTTCRRRTMPRAFDSAPGIGFDSDPMARAIVPPAGRITGTGPRLP